MWRSLRRRRLWRSLFTELGSKSLRWCTILKLRCELIYRTIGVMVCSTALTRSAMPIPTRWVTSICLLNYTCIWGQTLIDMKVVRGSIWDILLMNLIYFLKLFATDPLIQFCTDVETRLTDFKGSFTGCHGHIITRWHDRFRFGLIINDSHILAHCKIIPMTKSAMGTTFLSFACFLSSHWMDDL